METVNIKFDEKQLYDIIKRVTENIMKEAEKDSITELTYKEPKKHSKMLLEAYETHHGSEKEKIYFGHRFNTFSKEYASRFDLSDEFDREKVEELKKQGWKEEVFYK